MKEFIKELFNLEISLQNAPLLPFKLVAVVILLSGVLCLIIEAIKILN